MPGVVGDHLAVGSNFILSAIYTVKVVDSARNVLKNEGGDTENL